MRPRWRKVLSDLWDNKSRTLLVVLSIAVGVFAVGMIAGAYVIISDDLGASYASGDPANIQLYTTDFDSDMITTIEHIPSVKDAEGRREMGVRVRKPGNGDVGAGEWLSINLLANKDFENSTINLLRPIAGAKFPAKRQLVLEKKVLGDMYVAVGDLLDVELPDGTIRQMEIAGIVLDQTTAAGDFLANPMGYVTFDTLDWLRQPEAFNRLYVTVTDEPNNREAIRKVADRVSNQLEDSGMTVSRTRLSKTNQHPMTSTVQAVLGILGALGILIVFLSSSLIANTLAALLNAHQRYIGVMKLVGARSSQIIIMYLALITAFGLLALVIAVPLGAQAAYALSAFVSEKLNFTVYGYRLVPFAVILQAIIALGVPLAAGMLPVISGARVTVQQAISGYNAEQASGHKGFIDRTVQRIKFLSRPYLISLRNTFRRKARLALTLFTLTMGGAIFIAVFNVQKGLDNYIGQIGHYFLADVTLNLDRPYRINKIYQQAMQIPGVEYVEGWSFVSGEVLNPDDSVAENIQVLAPPTGSPLVKPNLIAGRWLQSGDDRVITVSETILDTFPNLQPGDTLRLKLNNKEEDWLVAGIFKFVGGTGDSNLVYANYETISKLTNQVGRAFSYRLVAGCNGNQNCQQAMTTLVDRTFRDAGYHVSQAESGASTLQTASESLGILVTFLLIMALLTAVVGSIGLTGTMGMNVLERTREIGVMRSIGAVDLQVVKSVLFEGMFIGLISWGLGVLLSFPITWMLSRIISLAIFKTPIDLALNWQGFAIWLGLVLLLSAIASILPARNASRLTIREVLAYE